MYIIDLRKNLKGRAPQASTWLCPCHCPTSSLYKSLLGSYQLKLKALFPLRIHHSYSMSSQLFLVIFTIVLSLFFFMKLKNRTIGTRKLPPGPKKLPLIGNLHQIGDLPHRSLQHLSNEYGPLMFMQLGSIPTLVISSVDMAREIFRTRDIVFSGRSVLYAAKKFSYNCNDITFAPYGKYWREVRKIAMLELLTAKRVQSFEAIRDNEVTLMIDSISKCLNNPINLSELMMLLANNIICRVAFGQKVSTSDGTDCGKNKFYEILRVTQDLLGGFSVVDFFPSMGWFNKLNGLEARLEKNFKELDSFYDRVIEEHLDPSRSIPEHEDLVDVLLRVQSDPNQAIKLSNDQLKGVLTDMFIAGSDTSSATLVWIMTALIKNPLVMRKAQEEVRRIVKIKGKVEESDLSGLVYTKCVIKEGLRLHPPAPLPAPRETTDSCVIEGYEIPVKTRVFLNVKSIATDPKYWENPNEFLPERFLESSIDLRGQNFELVPFGIGRRGCPGISFSLPLMELALANILYRFDWTLPEGVKVEDIDMEGAFGLTMHKKTPLFLVPVPANVLSA